MADRSPGRDRPLVDPVDPCRELRLRDRPEKRSGAMVRRVLVVGLPIGAIAMVVLQREPVPARRRADVLAEVECQHVAPEIAVGDAVLGPDLVLVRWRRRPRRRARCAGSRVGLRRARIDPLRLAEREQSNGRRGRRRSARRRSASPGSAADPITSQTQSGPRIVSSSIISPTSGAGRYAGPRVIRPIAIGRRTRPSNIRSARSWADGSKRPTPGATTIAPAMPPRTSPGTGSPPG